LGEVGYSTLSMEAVADRAGVARPAVYRRWPSKLDAATYRWLTTAQPVEAHAGRIIDTVWNSLQLPATPAVPMTAALRSPVSACPALQAAPANRPRGRGTIPASGMTANQA
jgi:AcrR family transcriptional regulator